MKAILVIDVPSDYGDIADNKAIVTLRNGKLGTSLGIYNVPLKPMPQKKLIELACQKEDDGNDYGAGLIVGWNECIDKILGETE